MNERLYSILEPYDCWSNDKGEEKNLQAKKALYDFYEELLKYKPAKTYAKRDYYHMSYFFHLIHIKRAFMEQKYMRVCNELVSLMHYEPFFQKRIYYNVLKVLEDSLEIER